MARESSFSYLWRKRQGKPSQKSGEKDKKSRGWPNREPEDPIRHSLSARGIKNRKVKLQLKRGPRATATYRYFRHHKYAKEASIKSPEAARESIEALEEAWDREASKARKKRILEVAELAAYQARKLADDRQLDEQDRRDLVETARHYDEFVERHRRHV